MRNDLPLFKHQKEASDFIVARGGSGALFHEMGLGKTRTSIEILSLLRQTEPGLRMLVIAPISLLDAAWGADVQRFSDFTFWNLRRGYGVVDRGGTERGTSDDILAINYESLLSDEKLKSLCKMLKETSDKGTDWICILDESSKIKNHQASTTKTLLKMVKLFKHRIVMSGTPAPNSEIEYWPQMQFAVPGSLGTSLTVFRAHFFHFVNRYSKAETPIGRFATKQQAMETYRKCDIAMSSDKRTELMNLIKPLAHMAKKKDCLDLPEQIDEVRSIEMERMQRMAYDELERHLVLEIQNNVIAVPVAIAKLMKLRQLTSGFIYNKIGESLEMGTLTGTGFTGDAIYLEKEFRNPKIDELLEIIDEAGDQQVMIWIQFHWELIRICSELHKRWPGQVVTMSSLTHDRDHSITAFQQGKAKFMVAHPASAAHGLTFVNCSLQIFFSLDYSLEKYEQARARTHRAGQKNPCTYIHLLAKNSVDEIVFNALQKKGDAQKEVYDAFMGRLKK